MFEGAVLQAGWFFFCDVVVLFLSFWNFHVRFFLSFHSYFTFGSILCRHNLVRLLRSDPDLAIDLFLLIDPACSFTPIGIITRTLKIEDDGIYHWRVYLGGFALVVLSRLCQWYRRQGNDDENLALQFCGAKLAPLSCLSLSLRIGSTIRIQKTYPKLPTQQ